MGDSIDYKSRRDDIMVEILVLKPYHFSPKRRGGENIFTSSFWKDMVIGVKHKQRRTKSQLTANCLFYFY